VIATVAGRLVEADADGLVVEVGGVGLRVHASAAAVRAARDQPEAVRLHTHLVVREDAHLLYGFATAHERRAFRLLLKISGIGAKIALAVLSGLSVAELAQAITMQESGRLTKVPGIGKKTAERILLEMKDKLGADLTTAVGVHRPVPASSDILNALVTLGYSDKEAIAAVKDLPDGIAVADGIRQALKRLGKA
jgi:Holliday junction DNA helicase RuvA